MLPQKIIFSFSYINLKTNGTNNIKIYSDDFEDKPDIITINNIINYTNTNITNIYNFNNSEYTNNITLIWNNPLNSTANMFSICENIIEIDLSNFDTSSVTTMKSMFYKCSSLTFLNLTNFDTSNVTSMMYMFYSCSSLISLDLSSFNTSKVTTMF